MNILYIEGFLKIPYIKGQKNMPVIELTITICGEKCYYAQTSINLSQQFHLQFLLTLQILFVMFALPLSVV